MIAWILVVIFKSKDNKHAGLKLQGIVENIKWIRRRYKKNKKIWKHSKNQKDELLNVNIHPTSLYSFKNSFKISL